MSKVIDIKSKKLFQQTKLGDDDQIEWVVKEIVKVLKKADAKGFDAFNTSRGLAQLCVSYIHNTAPDTLSAQHLLLTTIGIELSQKVEERLEDRDA
jgi:hypothetical protein|tara:strand:- start:70 stop:357 length:288 start_codon:yes stop_codon:yes gene_type:complete